MRDARDPMSKQPRDPLISGTRWHRWVGVLILLGAIAAPAEAQDAEVPSEPAEEGEESPEEESSTESASTETGSIETGGEDGEEAQEPPPSTELTAPSVAPSPASPPSPPAASNAQAAPTAGARERGWRMPRETVLRPLTLPQGVARFDSTVSFSVLGPRGFASGFFGLAVGVLDDLEIGATPFGITFVPALHFADPLVYVRARLISGEVQLALRSDVFIPVGELEAQWGLAAELAWIATPWFRLDVGLEYALLFSSPLNQRIGVPITATFQAGPNGFGVGTAVYVFNDFDDVDVPLLVSWTVAFPGFQGPLGEARIEGGFTDLERADSAWLIRGKLTFFAYF